MEFFKKRYGAVIITAFLIIFSIIFGVHKSLSRDMYAISDGFSVGVFSENDGYVKPSVEKQLQERCKAALLLATQAANYSDLSGEVSALRASRNALADLLDDRRLSPAALCSANQKMTDDFDALYKALEKSGRTDSMSGEYRSRMDNTARLIETSGYNESVLEFRRKTLNAFPANLLKIFAFAPEPELFKAGAA